MRSLVISIALLLLLPLVGHGTYNMPFSPHGVDFCDLTGPTGGADSEFCDDFEMNIACTTGGRGPQYTDLTGAGAGDISCTSNTAAIDGTYSLEFTTTTDDGDLQCADGSGGCAGFNAPTSGTGCYRFTVRIDDDTTSAGAQSLFIIRDSADAEIHGLSFDKGTTGFADIVVGPDQTTYSDDITNGVAKTYCFEINQTGSVTSVYSGSDCGTTVDASTGWAGKSDYGAFRVRSHADNVNVHLDNITIDTGTTCQTRW